MKRVIHIAVVLSLLLAMACPAFATEDAFVPSISEKEGPIIVVDDEGCIGVVLDEDGRELDKLYEACLVITPIAKAEESTEIPEDARMLLLDVYEKLLSGAMVIPAEKLDADLEADEIVIRDLVDLTWLCEEHPEMVAPKGVVFRITLDIGVSAEETIYVMTYKNHEWNPIVEVVNNGDGTLTCTFEDLCPVAFIVGDNQDAPITGSNLGNEVIFWAILMVSAAAAIVVILVYRRRSCQG